MRDSRRSVQRSTEKPSARSHRPERPERPIVRSVGIVSRPRREELATVVPSLLHWLEEHGVEAFCDTETVSCLSPAFPARPREELASMVDLLIVLGGDGTLLAAARLMTDRNIPVLPINLGSLGFLTSVTLDDMYSVLELALYGQARYSERVLRRLER